MRLVLPTAPSPRSKIFRLMWSSTIALPLHAWATLITLAGSMSGLRIGSVPSLNFSYGLSGKQPTCRTDYVLFQSSERCPIPEPSAGDRWATRAHSSGRPKEIDASTRTDRDKFRPRALSMIGLSTRHARSILLMEGSVFG